MWFAIDARAASWDRGRGGGNDRKKRTDEKRLQILAFRGVKYDDEPRGYEGWAALP